MIILVYNISQYDLLNSYVFMFGRVHVWTPTVCVLYVMSFCPLISDHGISQQFPKVNKVFPILVGDHAQGSILWNIYLRHNVLDVVVVFKYDNPDVNNIQNMHSQ